MLSILAVVPVAANSTPQALPFHQNWTNTGLITTNNVWTGVPGVSGFQGATIAVTGADPQQVTVDDTTLNVLANQTDPAGLSQGGVAEFEISDPVVAIKGGTSWKAPSIVISVNTTGLTNIHVAYNLRDIDASTNNAFQQVALQYRLASTGSFTNLPAGYVADATNLYLALRVSVMGLGNSAFDGLFPASTFAPGNDILRTVPWTFEDASWQPTGPATGSGSRTPPAGERRTGHRACGSAEDVAVYEVAHPLNSSDDLHDFSLTVPSHVDYVGLFQHCIAGSCAFTNFTPYPSKIVVVSERTSRRTPRSRLALRTEPRCRTTQRSSSQARTMSPRPARSPSSARSMRRNGSRVRPRSGPTPPMRAGTP